MQLKALPGTFYRAGRLQPVEPSPRARERLRLLQAWEALRGKGLWSVECSQVLQVPRATIYRWRSLEAHGRATAHAAAGFLDTVLERMPFPVRAIQVDGGSEFMAQFENACRERGVKLFVLPPRSPKLNGHVERAQRTHKEESYYRLTSATTLTQVNKLLRRWEDVHNTYRPHQALGQTTPLAFYRKCA